MLIEGIVQCCFKVYLSIIDSISRFLNDRHYLSRQRPRKNATTTNECHSSAENCTIRLSRANSIDVIFLYSGIDITHVEYLAMSANAKLFPGSILSFFSEVLISIALKNVSCSLFLFFAVLFTYTEANTKTKRRTFKDKLQTNFMNEKSQKGDWWSQRGFKKLHTFLLRYKDFHHVSN